MSSRLDRSHGCTCAVPPASATCSATSSSFSRVRETSSTSAPASPSLRAVSNPMPLEAPVIMIRLPLTEPASERSRNRSGSRLRSQ